MPVVCDPPGPDGLPPKEPINNIEIITDPVIIHAPEGTIDPYDRNDSEEAALPPGIETAAHGDDTEERCPHCGKFAAKTVMRETKAGKGARTVTRYRCREHKYSICLEGPWRI